VGDAAALTGLYRAAVTGIGPRAYTPAQVAVWAALAPGPERLTALMADGRWRLVAVDGQNRPVAFADLERDGHIDFFYCHPSVAGTGVAGVLYRRLEAEARAAALARLYAEASEVAVGFFRRQGFTVLGRRDLVVSGVGIHNHAVEKALAEQGV
jgi:putative acetyltransferase